MVSRQAVLFVLYTRQTSNSPAPLSAPRLGRHGKVFLTIPSQSSIDEQKFIQKGEAPGTDSLFDLDPEDLVFFVGGFPPDMKVTCFINFPRVKKISFINNDFFPFPMN